MQEPKIPPNDDLRLQAVEDLDILDTPPEDAFDRITRMAARIMEVPMAAVTIVDKNRQWFKSRVGLDVQETPRKHSFCGHAINSESLFIVTNAKEDERFFDNPLVTGGPHISFYIGIPVSDPNGYPIGTLCAISDEVKTPTETQKVLLLDLAKMVESELKMRQESTTDVLSGLMNRRLFNDVAQVAWGQSMRQKKPMSLMMIDIDNFKDINDTLGHAVGDQVISKTGEVLRSKMKRASDVVARLGGDEFIAVFPDCDLNHIGKMANSIHAELDDALRSLLSPLDHRFDGASVSIGATTMSPEQLSGGLSDMVIEADRLLYESKRKGRDCVTVQQAA